MLAMPLIGHVVTVLELEVLFPDPAGAWAICAENVLDFDGSAESEGFRH